MWFRILIISIISCTLFFTSCSDDNDNQQTTGNSGLQLKLVDAPGDYLEVNVEIIDVLYNDQEGDNGWLSLGEPSDYPIQVDLTELVAGNELLLVDQLIPSGNLEQLRLVLSENNTLVIEDENGEPETVPLSTPSAQQSGLKLKLETELEAGFSYTFILDWDVDKSIVKAGNSGNYILKPVINVIPEVNSGSISGLVVDDVTTVANATVEVYNELDEYVTSTQTNELGAFLVQGLSEGNYTLSISVAGYEDYVSPDLIGVMSGVTADVGTITLIPL
jgi:hypothetical protein